LLIVYFKFFVNLFTVKRFIEILEQNVFSKNRFLVITDFIFFILFLLDLLQTEKMLSTWMIWFLRRYAQYIDWAENGEPKVMWLSGLHIPETYIAALVQTACRDRGWPLDRSTTYTQV
jgi:hypothetical protein